eukprot:GHVU01195844.1.p4 GENE.GHVU01195844.1~~GHVU01195844.1.p4  ORF type:complete len:150 (-),score=9.35 GHVU01195844.1:3866-4315(-)
MNEISAVVCIHTSTLRPLEKAFVFRCKLTRADLPQVVGGVAAGLPLLSHHPACTTLPSTHVPADAVAVEPVDAVLPCIGDASGWIPEDAKAVRQACRHLSPVVPSAEIIPYDFSRLLAPTSLCRQTLRFRRDPMSRAYRAHLCPGDVDR